MPRRRTAGTQSAELAGTAKLGKKQRQREVRARSPVEDREYLDLETEEKRPLWRREQRTFRQSIQQPTQRRFYNAQRLLKTSEDALLSRILGRAAAPVGES